MSKNNWSRDELILAFNLYCKTSFGRIHIHNPDIISLAKILSRSPSAVSWKLANFARLDPALQNRNISGASHGSKMDVEIWEEFNGDWSKLSFESEKLLAEISGNSIETASHIDTSDLPRKGKERQALIRVRVNQSFFRRAVLASYDSRCCITGLSIPDLLNASHIVPWSDDPTKRVNPINGLCLNVFHDRAFDRGLMTVTTDYVVRVSSLLKNNKQDEAAREFLFRFDGKKIRSPNRFAPDKECLRYHNDMIFERRAVYGA
jgi:putative restriction endonuclease